MTPPLTVAEHLEYLCPGASSQAAPPSWPPDLFAISASLLAVSGGYCVVSCNWPPRKNWADSVQACGESWRRSWKKNAPVRVQKLWKQVTTAGSVPIENLSNKPDLCTTLIELLAVADEASAGAGIPYDYAYGDSFSSHAEWLLLNSNHEGGASLCQDVREAAARVLPKMHVPQSGFTLRSFSHYLALLPSSEITPYWYPIGGAPAQNQTLEILILPWPLVLAPNCFKSVDGSQATIRNMPPQYGFFEFQHTNPESLVEDVIEKINFVAAVCRKKIDMVVMPELALCQGEYEQLSRVLVSRDIQFIAGVGGERNSDGTRQNSVRFDTRMNIQRSSHGVSTNQPKHHRWKIDDNQVVNYGLALPKGKQLWEHIPVKDRSLSFICLRNWLALCILICEDLARPDPVGDLIRAVGPNLVIALLLDGPQLESRWSARYATALADDPGSSVLTLTCVGMSALSNPPNKAVGRHKGKIGLWKDIRGKVHVIDIGRGDAALLHVELVEKEGWTADGRSDGRSSSFPVLRSFSTFKGKKKINQYEVK